VDSSSSLYLFRVIALDLPDRVTQPPCRQTDKFRLAEMVGLKRHRRPAVCSKWSTSPSVLPTSGLSVMSKKPKIPVSRPASRSGPDKSKRSRTPTEDELKRRVDDTLTTEEVKLLKFVVANVRKLRAQEAIRRSNGRLPK